MSRNENKPSTPARDALLQAARLEFAERGYAGATTREIAKRADVSEVMLFRHFGSKLNLFREAIFQPLDRNMVAFKNTLFQAGPRQRMSPTAWQAYSAELREFLDENKSLLVALIVASASEKSTTVNMNDLTSLDDYFTHATQAMADSMTGEDRAKIGDPAIIVRLTFSLVATLVLFGDWLFPEQLMRRGDVIDVMTRFVERALDMDPPATNE